MRRTCQDFIATRLPFPGLAAYGVRLPDGSLLHQSFDRRLSPPQVKQVLAELTRTFETLQSQQIVARRITWVFEHLRVILSLRPDQVCLALFLENRSDLPQQAIQTVLDEFAQLEPTNQN